MKKEDFREYVKQRASEAGKGSFLRSPNLMQVLGKKEAPVYTEDLVRLGMPKRKVRKS